MWRQYKSKTVSKCVAVSNKPCCVLVEACVTTWAVSLHWTLSQAGLKGRISHSYRSLDYSVGTAGARALSSKSASNSLRGFLELIWKAGLLLTLSHPFVCQQVKTCILRDQFRRDFVWFPFAAFLFWKWLLILTAEHSWTVFMNRAQRKIFVRKRHEPTEWRKLYRM